MQEEILRNGNNKIIKKYRKAASSSYPPRSLNNGQNPGNADKNEHFRGCFFVFGPKMVIIIRANRKYDKRAFC